MNFWRELRKSGPILSLAPLANVTDAAFRYIISKYSKRGDYHPFVSYTEFVSADGLVLAPEEGRQKLLKDLEYSEIERPVVAQFFTSYPENMEKAARLALHLGFDGVDINMGCPDKSVEKQGAGAALIRNPNLARELIRAAKRGVEGKLPVSVKTRLGYNKDELEEWLPELLAEQPETIIIHARTRKEMSKVPARWERVGRAVEIRDELETLILGNGDVVSVEDALEKCRDNKTDGAMLGRAVFGNPWLFSTHVPNINEKLRVLVEHTRVFEEKFGGTKSFAIMKKHYKAYVNGFEGAPELRAELMEARDYATVDKIITRYLFASL